MADQWQIDCWSADSFMFARISTGTARYPLSHPAAAPSSHAPHVSSSMRRSPERQSTLASSHRDYGHRREARSRNRSLSTALDDLDVLLLESANGLPRGGHSAPHPLSHPTSRSPEWSRDGNGGGWHGHGTPYWGATLDVPHVHGSHTPSTAGSIGARGGVGYREVGMVVVGVS
ncbi:hypothetical protein B0H13DRAFT_2266054 [Mycena leptocephala]|nr:hypothetical protein B0H13DRAFT_2266054 [Mycena leptocephala]